MIALAFQIAGAIAVGVLIARAAKIGETHIRARAAARRQASWEKHIGQAVKVSETPLYERIAQEFAKDLDEEWRRASSGEWGTA